MKPKNPRNYFNTDAQLKSCRKIAVNALSLYSFTISLFHAVFNFSKSVSILRNRNIKKKIYKKMWWHNSRYIWNFLGNNISRCTVYRTSVVTTWLYASLVYYRWSLHLAPDMRRIHERFLITKRKMEIMIHSLLA